LHAGNDVCCGKETLTLSREEKEEAHQRHGGRLINPTTEAHIRKKPTKFWIAPARWTTHGPPKLELEYWVVPLRNVTEEYKTPARMATLAPMSLKMETVSSVDWS
jgi:hypothetical protein